MGPKCVCMRVIRTALVGICRLAWFPRAGSYRFQRHVCWTAVRLLSVTSLEDGTSPVRCHLVPGHFRVAG
jgi:hypothetical protein